VRRQVRQTDDADSSHAVAHLQHRVPLIGKADTFRHCDREVSMKSGNSSRRDLSEDSNGADSSDDDGDRRPHDLGSTGDIKHDRSKFRQRSRDKAKWIKPEKFNGHGSFETFLVQFENCASYNRWSQADKLAHLRWSLTGSAAQLLWGSEDLSYDELLNKLKKLFSGKGMEEKFQSELRCRRRNRGESLRELAQDIQRLMILAYPGEQSSLSEQLARDAFLSALADPEFELKIREREPTNLDDPLRIAQRYEVFSFSTAAGERQAAEIYSADESSSETTKSAVQTEDGKRYVELNGSSKRRDLKNGDSGWKEEIIQRLAVKQQ